MKTSKVPPIQIHPENPKILLFRDEPTVLITATEHYGAVFNRPFDFAKYLQDCGGTKINYTRLFVLFREQQSATNPYSTCKPESTDFISPFVRVGPERAHDGQMKYDLDQWNPEFFDRLHRFCSLASQHGVIIEITLLSNTYDAGVWALNPLNAANNINNLDVIRWPDYMSLRSAKLVERQLTHVRKIVSETMHYDNVIYEICNEPGGGIGSEHPTTADVNAWQREIAKVIRETEAGQTHRHLISGQEAFAYRMADESRRGGPDVFQTSDESFDSFLVDIVNMHPLSNMIARDKVYNVGQFMLGQMKLAELKQYCRDLYAEKKPMCLDEDNCATQYRDVRGWVIHQKRAWIALFSGAHYNCIDFSINNYLETGSPLSAGPVGIRSRIMSLTRFMQDIDLVEMRPIDGIVKHLPPNMVEATITDGDGRYFIYAADAREWDGGKWEPFFSSGKFILNILKGTYHLRTCSPGDGKYSPAISVVSDGTISLDLPEMIDIVICIERYDA